MTWKRFENFINSIKIFIIQCNNFHCNCNLLWFCFVLLVMGLGLRFRVFSSYGSPLCILHFGVCSLVWTPVFFFFSPSCSIAGWLSFIYLFIPTNKNMNKDEGPNWKSNLLLIINVNILMTHSWSIPVYVMNPNHYVWTFSMLELLY
jgi:hypothetical protein